MSFKNWRDRNFRSLKIEMSSIREVLEFQITIPIQIVQEVIINLQRQFGRESLQFSYAWKDYRERGIRNKILKIKTG